MHDFVTVSKILGDETGKAVRFNIEMGLPEYSLATVDRLFPPTPYGVDLMTFAAPVTPRKPDSMLNFDTSVYPFADIVRKIIAPTLSELSQLHTVQTIDNVGIQLYSATRNPLNGSISEFHDAFYRRLNQEDGWPEFMDMFKKFVKEVVFPLFPPGTRELVYQKSPTFRVQLPGSSTVFTLHGDGDKDNVHPAGELNFMLPLSAGCGNSASMWVESLPFLGDFHPVPMEYVAPRLGRARERGRERERERERERCARAYACAIAMPAYPCLNCTDVGRS